MSNDSLNTLDLHEGKYHHAPCMYTLDTTLHLKTTDNISNEDVRGGGEELQVYEFATIKQRSALYKKEAANSMIKGLFLLPSTISFPPICLQD